MFRSTAVFLLVSIVVSIPDAVLSCGCGPRRTAPSTPQSRCLSRCRKNTPGYSSCVNYCKTLSGRRHLAMDQTNFESFMDICGDGQYQLSLFVDSQPHLHLIAEPVASRKKWQCRESLDIEDFGFAGPEIQFTRYRETEIDKSFPIGTYSLGNIRKAVDGAETGNSIGDFDFLTNNCALFVLNVLKNLDSPVTIEMLDYVVDRIATGDAAAETALAFKNSTKVDEVFSKAELETFTEHQIVERAVVAYAQKFGNAHANQERRLKKGGGSKINSRVLKKSASATDLLMEEIAAEQEEVDGDVYRLQDEAGEASSEVADNSAVMELLSKEIGLIEKRIKFIEDMIAEYKEEGGGDEVLEGMQAVQTEINSTFDKVKSLVAGGSSDSDSEDEDY